MAKQNAFEQLVIKIFKYIQKSVRMKKAEIDGQNWSIVERGASLSELELITILDCIGRERVKDFSLLSKVAGQISKSLGFTLGRGNWNVIFLHGKLFAKRFVASGKYYIILRRIDDLTVFIWLNKIKGSEYK